MILVDFIRRFSERLKSDGGVLYHFGMPFEMSRAWCVLVGHMKDVCKCQNGSSLICLTICELNYGFSIISRSRGLQ